MGGTYVGGEELASHPEVLGFLDGEGFEFDEFGAEGGWVGEVVEEDGGHFGDEGDDGLEGEG